MVGADKRKVLDRLPYIGLDIESVEGDEVRVEYSPNRPDFGTDFGIARALRGLLGKETGLPRYPVSPSGIKVAVDPRLSRVRPYIACVVARGLRFDDEDVRQIISLQEDLHNGLGRRRKVVAIGLHDLDAVKPPLSYRGVDSSFKFVALGNRRASTIRQILEGSPEGRTYGAALGDAGVFPIISDSAGTVLSFPPIINGDATKVTTKTRNIFVDVTSTDSVAGDRVLAVLATTLADAGARLWSVSIGYRGKPRVTPDLSPEALPLDVPMIRSALGMELTRNQVVGSLARSRLSVKGGKVFAPRYRVDLLHPVDIAEEVAVGYGVDRIGPLYPPSKQPGTFDRLEEFFDSGSTVMAGSGMIELMTFELVDEKSLYSNFSRPSAGKISVHDPRSIDHSILRDALIPSLMTALTENVKSDYPQRVYEVGRVYTRTSSGVSESWHLGCLDAHSQSSYTEAKMYLESAVRTLTGKEVATVAAEHWAFAPGRSASVRAGGKHLGHVGEVKPESLEAFGLRVPVSGFEIDLSALYELLK
jgi:phenylalanyl-tRNA synthetase beta chain